MKGKQRPQENDRDRERGREEESQIATGLRSHCPSPKSHRHLLSSQQEDCTQWGWEDTLIKTRSLLTLIYTFVPLLSSPNTTVGNWKLDCSVAASTGIHSLYKYNIIHTRLWLSGDIICTVADLCSTFSEMMTSAPVTGPSRLLAWRWHIKAAG